LWADERVERGGGVRGVGRVRRVFGSARASRGVQREGRGDRVLAGALHKTTAINSGMCVSTLTREPGRGRAVLGAGWRAAWRGAHAARPVGMRGGRGAPPHPAPHPPHAPLSLQNTHLEHDRHAVSKALFLKGGRAPLHVRRGGGGLGVALGARARRPAAAAAAQRRRQHGPGRPAGGHGRRRGGRSRRAGHGGLFCQRACASPPSPLPCSTPRLKKHSARHGREPRARAHTPHKHIHFFSLFRHAHETPRRHRGRRPGRRRRRAGPGRRGGRDPGGPVSGAVEVGGGRCVAERGSARACGVVLTASCVVSQPCATLKTCRTSAQGCASCVGTEGGREACVTLVAPCVFSWRRREALAARAACARKKTSAPSPPSSPTLHPPAHPNN
jgi:hypothetical protein